MRCTTHPWSAQPTTRAAPRPTNTHHPRFKRKLTETAAPKPLLLSSRRPKTLQPNRNTRPARRKVVKTQGWRIMPSAPPQQSSPAPSAAVLWRTRAAPARVLSPSASQSRSSRVSSPSSDISSFDWTDWYWKFETSQKLSTICANCKFNLIYLCVCV